MLVLLADCGNNNYRVQTRASQGKPPPKRSSKGKGQSSPRSIPTSGDPQPALAFASSVPFPLSGAFRVPSPEDRRGGNEKNGSCIWQSGLHKAAGRGPVPVLPLCQLSWLFMAWDAGTQARARPVSGCRIKTTFDCSLPPVAGGRVVALFIFAFLNLYFVGSCIEYLVTCELVHAAYA